MSGDAGFGVLRAEVVSELQIHDRGTQGGNVVSTALGRLSFQGEPTHFQLGGLDWEA